MSLCSVAERFPSRVSRPAAAFVEDSMLPVPVTIDAVTAWAIAHGVFDLATPGPVDEDHLEG
jgi:hypothetical protein